MPKSVPPAMSSASKCARSSVRPAHADDVEQYAQIINRNLPDDIKVLACVPVSEAFNARFDCRGREYNYFFMKRKLDIAKMRAASKKLEGEHDFRNLCKINVLQTENFVRVIKSVELYRCNFLAEGAEDDELVSEQCADKTYSPIDLFYFKIRANAFIWHQVEP